MPQLPKLMRRCRVREVLGLSKHDVEKLVENDILHPVQLRPRGKYFYLSSEVMGLAGDNGTTGKRS